MIGNTCSYLSPLFQKKRLSITHSFGSEASDSSDGLLCAMDSPPRTPGLGLLASDKDRSSTPLSSGSEERQFVVKVENRHSDDCNITRSV